MMKIIDISVPISANLPTWPNSTGVEITTVARYENDGYNESSLKMGVHVGTHIDAPKHFSNNGLTVEQLSIKTMIGKAFVTVYTGKDVITSDSLDNMTIPVGVKRLLIKTSNSDYWKNQNSNFHKNFIALSSDAAQWIVNRGICLIGIDYLSIQKFGASNLTHEILLSAKTVILEGLNLSEVEEGKYELICLPLFISNVEGAPARAVLRY